MQKRRSAFTFVEIMMTAVLLVLGFFPLYSLMRGNLRRAKFQKVRVFGSSLAQNLLERIRGCSLKFLDDGSGGAAGVAGGGGGTTFSAEMAGGFLDQDPLLNPKPNQDGVPGDAEFTRLLERWESRRKLYAIDTMPIGPGTSGGLATSKLRLVGIRVKWGKDTTRLGQAPSQIEELSTGAEHLSVIAIAGEGLFHPPPPSAY